MTALIQRLSMLCTWLMLVASPVVQASAEPREHFDVTTTIGSLFLVILVIIVLMLILKKMRVPSLLNHKDLAIIRQIPVGTKERIAVVKAGDEQFLVGITAHNISLVSKLDAPIVDEPSEDKAFSSHLSKLLKKNPHAE
ncbi:flagellar biosynthetic protein FliO [Vibrio sp. FNV 38]|nr:flagellar biosynthetic protein FliO [Vibrio sp. FNV 38]